MRSVRGNKWVKYKRIKMDQTWTTRPSNYAPEKHVKDILHLKHTLWNQKLFYDVTSLYKDKPVEIRMKLSI